MLGLLGDEWTLLVIQQALLGATRYGEFAARLPISNSVLTRRLQALTADGLLTRRSYRTNPPRAEYLVTPRSRSLWPVLVSIWEWERHWVPDHAERLPGMRHTACGGDFAPLLTCRVVWRDGQRERRCRAVGSERLLAAVDARCRDPAAIGGRPARRRGRPVPADDERPRQPLGVRAAGGRVRRDHAGSPTFRHAGRAAGFDRRPPADLQRQRRVAPPEPATDTASPRRAGRSSRSWSAPCSGRNGGFARPRDPR